MFNVVLLNEKIPLFMLCNPNGVILWQTSIQPNNKAQLKDPNPQLHCFHLAENHTTLCNFHYPSYTGYTVTVWTCCILFTIQFIFQQYPVKFYSYFSQHLKEKEICFFVLQKNLIIH